MTMHVLNPTSETDPPETVLAARLESLAGTTIGVISNGKEGTAGFFRHLDRILRERYGVGEVVLRQKSNYSAPAEPEIIEAARDWDAAVTGIGD